jgi:uncharacterized phiE125 gp8 family phage protein
MNPRQSIQILTPPSDLPVMRSDVQRHLGVTDDEHDLDIERLIRMAANNLTKQAGIALQSTTYMLTMDMFPKRCAVIRLPYPPLQSITTFEHYVDGAPVALEEGTDYQIVPGTSNLMPGIGMTMWPGTDTDRVDAINITYVAGYPTQDDLPAEAAQYINVSARASYDNPDGYFPSEIQQGLRSLAMSLWAGRYPDPDTFPY